MEIATVTWKQRVPTKGIDAVKAYELIEKLRVKNDGSLTDDAIVNAAKPKNNLLHQFFEWDDSVASVEYRRMQARQLIRSFEVTYKDTPDVKTRAYEVHTKRSGQDERTEYKTTVDVLSQTESRDQLIASAIRQAMEFRRRFKHLHELDMVIEAIDKVLVKLGAGE